MTKVSVHQLGITGDLNATVIADHLRKGDFSMESAGLLLSHQDYRQSEFLKTDLWIHFNLFIR